jgi:phosphoribosylamine---glycine ligase
MKVLVVGSGGREHALVWKIGQSPLVDKVYCAPGNAGIADLAECVPIQVTDILALRRFVRENGIELTVVGPEEPLVRGIVDEFQAVGLKVFGPQQAAARLEGSKVFSKQLMARHGIPTAEFRVFTAPDSAKDYIEQVGTPIVVKADGLAAGKAAIVCKSLAEAFDAVDQIMVRRVFGDAGNQLLVEQCLVGEEASMIAITDGTTIAVMASSQDHKAALDGDQGLNTGGMGAYSPAPVITPELAAQIERRVLVQTIHGMNREEKPFSGVLYAGIMVTADGPQVLEYNCRLGDPETQPLLMRLKSDLVPILLGAIDGTLDQVEMEWDERPACCVVMASGGYPGPYRKGVLIHGLAEAARVPDTMVFHAGTALQDSGIVTNGGRVLGVTSLGETIVQARERAYEAVSRIQFDGAHYRTDIGAKAIGRM